VKIEGDNITVYFDENLIRANFGFEVQNTSGALAGGPSNMNHRVTDSRTLPLPAGYGDTVYLFFHNAGGISWNEGTGNDWREVSRVPFTVPYNGKLTLTITGPNGFFHQDTDFDGIFVEFSAETGDYTITLSSNDGDFNPITERRTVFENQTATVEFEIELIGEDEPIYRD